MAIDTREKRQAVVGLGHYFSGPSVTPNASPDQEWRQEAGWGYPGILADSPPVVVVTDNVFGAGMKAGYAPEFTPDGVIVVLRGQKRAAGGLGRRQNRRVFISTEDDSL